ncbi:surfeit locus protein 1 isoform X2 [Aristolochia californica]|uniref:surfeit locus protein 1 isoform X2 n=1 Tax=Aristolochia californica TaxID=171875 RepID=UPI0035E3B2CF
MPMAASVSKILSRTLKPQNVSLATVAGTISKPIPTFGRTLCTGATSFQSQGSERDGWSKWLLFAPGVFTFGLGTWQIFRRNEKMQMLDYRKNRLDMEPIAWTGSPSSGEELNSLEFRRVLCEGTFDESRSVFVGPRSRSISGVTENGYFIITPLVPTTNNSRSVQLPVLVNRGWVPRSWRVKHLEELGDAEKPENIRTTEVGKESGSSSWWFWSKKPEPIKNQEPVITPVKVLGVVRGSEKPSIFVPSNDPSSGQWFYVDVPGIARACGLPEDTLYIEDINENASPSLPYPVPKDVNSLIRYSVMPQDHMNYTLTWYSLSAAVTFMAIKRVKPRKARR